MWVRTEKAERANHDVAGGRPLDVDSTCSEAEADRAFEVVDGGGVVLVRTVVGYGLIGRSDEAIRRMYALKQRPAANPLIVVGNIPLLERITVPLPGPIRGWLDDIIGRTTLAVINDLDPASPLLAKLTPLAREHGTKDGTVAVFLNTGWMPEQLASRALQAGYILLGTSANASGKGNSHHFSSVPAEMVAGVDYYLDQGPSLYQTRDKIATTIVDLRRLTTTRIGVEAGMIMNELKQFQYEQNIAR